MTPPVLRPLSVGEVLDTGFGLYRANFFPLLIVAVATRLVPDVLDIYTQQIGGFLVHPVLSMIWLVVGVALGAIGVAATTYIVSSAYLGGVMTPNEALRQASHRMWRIIALAFMTTVVVLAGFILFIVPGFILMSGLALSTTALILERLPSASGAMSRSWALTRGQRGKVFVTLLVTGLLFLVPLIVVGVLFGILSLTGVVSTLIGQVVGALLGTFIYPLLYVVVIVLYYDMRVRKEGFDLELLAAATAPES